MPDGKVTLAPAEPYLVSRKKEHIGKVSRRTWKEGLNFLETGKTSALTDSR
ncbi:MAG: hypothetical protein M1476_07445 [Candidatus Thermoplasmatota archaeon]|nr:hypothetical protein [Candidatus Thermoplasmatota archaeon]